jgi:GT2 family glycosyltransferase
VTTSSVIVVSYRPGDWLDPCLESVSGQASQVVVVDNASEGHEATAAARRHGAEAVRCHRNLGFAGGVAAGLPRATGDIVGVLNDDAVAGPSWLSSAALALGDPSVAAVTPKVVLAGRFAEVSVPAEAWFAPGDSRPLGLQVRALTVNGRDALAGALGAGIHRLESNGAERWRWTTGPEPFYVPVPAADGSSNEDSTKEGSGEGGPGPEDLDVRVNGRRVDPGPVVRLLNHAGSFLRANGMAGEYGLGAPDDGRFDHPAERFGFSGTAPVFRAETLRRQGAFAPQFFCYNEDTDWCLRARLAGMRIRYDPSGLVTHRLSATSGGGGSALVRRLAQRNALLCLVRNAPVPVARRQVWDRLRHGVRDDVARQVVAKLPWAIASRRVLARSWVLDPGSVWARWADNEAESTWDRSPAEQGAR